MKPESQEKFNNFLSSLSSGTNKDWFIRFFKMLEDCGVDENIIDLALNLLTRPENDFRRTKEGERDPLRISAIAQGAQESFFNFMENMAKENGVEYLKNFLENAIIQMGMDFDRYVNEDHLRNTNFYNLFMRQLVKAFPEEVRIEDVGKKSMKTTSSRIHGGEIQISFAGIYLGHIQYDEESSNIPHMQFTDFRTLPGLEGMGLGTLLISEFCRQIVEYKPGYAMLAFNVKKGKDGDKTYSHWGGYPITISCDDSDTWIIDDTPWTREKYEANTRNMMFFFPESAVKALAEKRSTRYPNANIDSEKVIE